MNHAQSFYELVLNLDDMLVESVDKFTEELFLVSHLNILIYLLQDRKQVGRVDQTADVV